MNVNMLTSSGGVDQLLLSSGPTVDELFDLCIKPDVMNQFAYPDPDYAPRENKKRAKPSSNQELYPTLELVTEESVHMAPSYEPKEIPTDSFYQEYKDEAKQISAQLKDLQVSQQASKGLCARIALEIKNLTIPLPPDANKWEKSLNDLLNKVEQDLETVQRLHSNHIMEPKTLYKVRELLQSLFVEVQQLRLYQHEFQYLKQLTKAPTKSFACLLVGKQPFPKPIKQLKKYSTSGEDPIVVHLLKGAKTVVSLSGKMKASLVDESQGTKQPLDFQQEVIDNQAVFSNLMFKNGTRMKKVKLQFSLDVKYHTNVTDVLESDKTAPFIVFTNENQWDVAAGDLLKKEAFGPGREVQWPHFANILQFHYLRGTRQYTAKPERPLSLEDLIYFQRQMFGGKQTITSNDFDKFWEWFGKILSKIRHQKHFFPLWEKGYIYGFSSKEEAEHVLRTEPPGTFVLRFSERAAGKVTLVYVKKGESSNQIQHYLMDFQGDSKDTVTLPDFLTPQANLSHFLQISIDFFAAKTLSKKTSISKVDVLKPYISGRKLPGYVDVIQ